MAVFLLRYRIPILITLIASGLVAVINYWSVNFPNADDYTAVIFPLLKSAKATTLSSAVVPFFEPHTQHFQVLLRFIAWLAVLVTGSINFKGIIFLGSLFVLPLLLILRRWHSSGVRLGRLVATCLICALFRVAEGSETAYTTSRYTLLQSRKLN